MSIIKFAIPAPCHENWQNMTSMEHGRFCGSCNKAVTDFSRMDDREAYSALLKEGANSCGRFSAAQMKEGINDAAEKTTYWHKYFFSFLVPAFLFTKQSAAQMGIIAKRPVKCNPPVIERMILPFGDKSFELSGRVLDSASNEIIGYASVNMKGTDKGTMVNTKGLFKLKGKVKGSVVIVRITAIGYESKEIEIAIPVNGFVLTGESFYLKRQPIQLDEVKIYSTSAAFTSVMAGGYNVRVKSNRFKDMPARLLTAITDSIKITPNPVKRGNTFNLVLKLKQPGNHTIQIIDLAGRVFFQQSINISLKRYTAQINTGSTWEPGMYSLRVIGPDKNTIRVNRFIIE